MGIKKDEPDDDEDDDAPPELACNQEDADIRDMKYKLERLIFTFNRFDFHLLPLKIDPIILRSPFQTISMDT